MAFRTAWLGPLGLGARQGTDPHPVPLCLGTCVTRCQNPLTPTSPWYPHPPGTCIPWYPHPPAPTSPWHPYPLAPPSLRTDHPWYLQPPALLPSGPLTQVPPFPQDSQHHGTSSPCICSPHYPHLVPAAPGIFFPPVTTFWGIPFFLFPLSLAVTPPPSTPIPGPPIAGSHTLLVPPSPWSSHPSVTGTPWSPPPWYPPSWHLHPSIVEPAGPSTPLVPPTPVSSSPGTSIPPQSHPPGPPSPGSRVPPVLAPSRSLPTHPSPGGGSGGAAGRRDGQRCAPLRLLLPGPARPHGPPGAVVRSRQRRAGPEGSAGQTDPKQMPRGENVAF